MPLVFSLDETCDVGHDTGSPVSDDYRSEDSAFTGTVDTVLLEIAEVQPTSATWSTRS